MSTAWHLATKEIWRNRSRFLLFSLVIALITILVLFVAALSEGLGSGNREYIEKLEAELIVYQDTSQLSIPASRIDPNTLRAVRRVSGVADAGPVAFASASIPLTGRDPLDISLIGVEPGKPGEPPAFEGEGLLRKAGDTAIIDADTAAVTGAQPGDWIRIRSVQDDEETFYDIEVIGISDSRKYSIRPSVFVPYVTWDQIRTQAMAGGSSGPVPYNVLAVKLENPEQLDAMAQKLTAAVNGISVADRMTAYENTPGYSEQQSTLNTQRTFALLIGILVIGGFFQIQTLQKVGQIGMLKAVGTPNATIAISSLLQIVAITLAGVVIGSTITLLLSLGFPPNIPIVFTPQSAAMAVGSITIVGPLGGLVSIRYALRVEPLAALGLSS